VNALAAIAALALLATPRPGERLAVLAVHEPAALDLDLIELTHQLRTACGERTPGVLQAGEMRARLQGRTGNATAAELDRAFNGALAVYQNGEYESAERTLKAIVADLEELPESEGVWHQWTRAMMRLSHVQFTLGQKEESEATQLALLKVDASHQLDPMLYAPGYRAHFEELRARVRALPKRRLTVTARGRAGTVYVSGRDVGPPPVTLVMPAGSYRVAGAAGELRPPSVAVDLAVEDRAVTLDFALAEAVRIGNGPALALPPGDRAGALIKAGAWLGVDRLVVTTRVVEGDAPFLVGALYDVRRGALLREGSVRVSGGAVPGGSLGALAAFLLHGQPSREVNDRVRQAGNRPAPPPPPPAPPAARPPSPATTAPAVAVVAAPKPALAPPAPPVQPPVAVATVAHPATPPLPPTPDLTPHPPPIDPVAAAVTPQSLAPARPRPAWVRPVVIGAGLLSLGLAGLAIQQGRSARGAYADARALIGPNGILLPGTDPLLHDALVARGDGASRNAWLAGGAAVAAAAGAGLTWWLSP
jgi:hypothetical protein